MMNRTRKSVLFVFVAGVIAAAIILAVGIGMIRPSTSYGMPQSQFAQLTAGTGAIYLPYTGTADHYELVGISVLTGSVNDRIRVIVLDKNGQPAFNVMVRHSFGTDFERFAYLGDPVQFNLGVGSHYSVPNDPPDHIIVEGLPSDEVRIGNANIIGFAHIDAQMTFQVKGSAIPTPVVPTVTPTVIPSPTPGGPTPVPGTYITRQQMIQMLQNQIDYLRSLP